MGSARQAYTDRLPSIIDNMGDGFLVVDRELVVRYANGAARELLKRTSCEVLGREIFELLSPSVIEGFRARLQDSLETGNASFFDSCITGEEHDDTFEFRVNPHSDCISILFFRSNRRKTAERALMESEERFRALVESSPMAILLVRKGRYIYSNRAGTRLLGFKSNDQLGNIEAIESVAPGFRDKVLEHIDRAMKGEEPESFEIKICRGSNESAWLMCSIVIVQMGQEPATLIVGQDVTGRRLAEIEKDRLQSQFQQRQRLESVGRLASGVAHDLNNLLSPILGYGEMLLDESIYADPRREPIEQIVSAGERARDLVNQLLAFSRKQVLEVREVDLNDLVRNFHKLLRRTVRENIDIVTDLQEGLPHVQGDIGQLEQVLMNLAVNAQDAISGGGRIVIRTSTKESSEPDGDDLVLLEVTDSGCGMDEKTIEHIFEPFFTTKEKGKGTGLGLATVFGIVSQHGGQISVTSQPGAGTSFHLAFPALGGERVFYREKVSLSVADGGSETILLMEDDPQVRMIAYRILTSRGYKVLQADNCEQALQRAAEVDRISLLCTDVVMPGMNGPELFGKLSEIHPEMKVLYMSGYTQDVIMECGLDGSAADFIQKPFTFKTLAAKVRECLDTSRNIKPAMPPLHRGS
jgi:PAS domain S-box-containing protein